LLGDLVDRKLPGSFYQRTTFNLCKVNIMSWKKQVVTLLIAIALGAGAIKATEMYNEYALSKVSIAEVSVVRPKLDVQDYAWEQARKAKLDRATFISMIFGESRFNQNAIGVNKNGTVDLGLLQINSIHMTPKASALISPVDALDPYKAIDWAIKKRLKDGNYSAWVAAQNLKITK
jgi:soluble lytic murein transglycosylase-like protein